MWGVFGILRIDKHLVDNKVSGGSLTCVKGKGCHQR